MRKNPLQDIVNKIIWNKENAKIVYLDRKNGIRYVEIETHEILKAGTEFIFLKNGNMIPYHRIKYVEISGKIVYKKLGV